MRKPRSIDIRFPVAGQVRRYGYQSQPPYSTPGSLNVRPFDSLEGRERGGVRPGLVKCYSGADTKYAAQFDGVSQHFKYLGTACNPGAGDFSCGCIFRKDTIGAREDIFSHGDRNETGGCFALYENAGHLTALLADTPEANSYVASADNSIVAGTWYTVIVNCDRDDKMTLYVDGVSAGVPADITDESGSIAWNHLYLGIHSQGGSFAFDGRVDGAFWANRLLTPAEIAWLHNGGLWRTWVELGKSGTDGSGLTASVIKGFWDFEDSDSLGADSTGNGTTMSPQNTPTQAAAVTDPDVSQPVQLIAPITTVSSTGTIDEVLTIARGGSLYRKQADNTLDRIGGELNGSAKQLTADTLDQKLYLGDYRTTSIIGTDGTIASTNQLSATGISDWTALGIDTDLDVVVISESQGGDSDNDVYEITAVAEGYLTINGTLTNGACSYHVGRRIKVFDPSTNGMYSLTATYGIPPLDCRVVCVYRGRLVGIFKNTWFMSRAFDPTDWDYGYDPADPTRPMASGSSDTNDVPDIVLAGIPHSDDYLIFGCANSIWMLRGDPASGGSIDALSRKIGIVSASAWCKLPDGGIAFLSRDGVYLLPPGGSSEPIPLSRELLPAELTDVDVIANAVTMAYDVEARGIHLFVTPTDGSQGSHWWIDWTAKGFWPAQVPTGQQPYSLASYAASQADDQEVLLGCRDGVLRKFSAAALDDDGTAISNYFKVGPLRLGDSGLDGIVTELAGVLDDDSGGVTWELHLGDTGEAAVDSTSARKSGTWSAGRNRVTYPRARGVSAVLKIAGASGPSSAWAFEGARMVIAQGGRIR